MARQSDKAGVCVEIHLKPANTDSCDSKDMQQITQEFIQMKMFIVALKNQKV